MSILSGFIKTKKYRKTAEGYKLQSQWTSSGTVELSNQSTLESPTFTQASTRENIVSGENLPTIFGKLMKWFADLKTVAFTGAYSDLSGTPTSLPANGGTSSACSGNAATATTATKVANALTFTGGVTGSWDGSGTKSVAIPTSLPASDVYSWAKAASKPSYSAGEISGLGGAATQAVANNLTTVAAGSVLDARQGKILQDNINALNSNLSSVTVEHINITGDGNWYFSVASRNGYVPISAISISTQNLYVTGIAVDLGANTSYYIVRFNQAMEKGVTYGFYVTWVKITN